MSLSVKKDGKILELTHDAATAWTWQDATYGWGTGSQFLRVLYIHWIPAATDDVICIRNQSTSGPILFYAKAADVYDQRIIYYYGETFRPVIDQTTTTGAGQIIVFFVK